MNKIKLSMIAVITAFTIYSGAAKVQAQESSIALGLKGGINLSNLNGIENTKNTLKYQFGITADIALNNDIYLLSGIEFHAKGTKKKLASDTKMRYSAKYLQLPLHLGYKIRLSGNMKFVIDAGPYIAYGIGGKVKDKASKKNTFGKDGFKCFDYGVGGNLGVEFGKLSLNTGYDFGLANINKTKDTKVKNRNAFATLGYKF